MMEDDDEKLEHPMLDSGFIPRFTKKVQLKIECAKRQQARDKSVLNEMQNAIQGISEKDDANPFTESTAHESFVPTDIPLNMSECERIKTIALGEKDNPVLWPDRSKYGINEFEQENLEAACFPTLFPYGVGGFTAKRNSPISLREARAYYEKFADYDEETGIQYRFAKHHMWSFWLLNRAHRHKLLSQTNVFVKNTPSVNEMTREELVEELAKGAKNLIAMGIGRHEANVPGSDGYWHLKGEELLSAIRELSYPTVFYSFSFADTWCPELYAILPFTDEEHEHLEDISFERRQQVLGENLHLAAWFYHKRISEFTKHMNKVLQTDWYWQRIEAQFRTTLHTHGALKMKNDNKLLEHTHAALIGHLANEKLLHVENGLDFKKCSDDIDESNLFGDNDIASARNRINEIRTNILKKFTADLLKNVSDSTCYYVGIAFEQENNMEKVKSGNQEKQTSKQQGMLNSEVVTILNDLDPIDAYTLESDIIRFMKLHSDKHTLNKSSVFGLGNRPKHWRNLRCTLTLLRGTYRHTRYRAYPELDSLFEDCSTADELKSELKKLIVKRVSVHRKEIIKFVDYLVSTDNPIFDEDGLGVCTRFNNSSKSASRRNW